MSPKSRLKSRSRNSAACRGSHPPEVRRGLRAGDRLQQHGEAIGQHRYRAVFVDLVGLGSFGASSFRDLAYSKAESALRQLPVGVIDVSIDQAGVLVERMKSLSAKWGPTMVDYMHSGSHDLVCFFPGLAGEILSAVFFRDEDANDLVGRRIDGVERENPYSRGREPWLPDTIWTAFGRYEQKDREEAEAARRSAGETLFQVAPEEKPLLLEEHLWGESPRAPESLKSARRVGSIMSIRDSWWPSDPSGKFGLHCFSESAVVMAVIVCLRLDLLIWPSVSSIPQIVDAVLSVCEPRVAFSQICE